MLSLLVWPKVITLSGFYCILKWNTTGPLGIDKSPCWWWVVLLKWKHVLHYYNSQKKHSSCHVLSYFNYSFVNISAPDFNYCLWSNYSFSSSSLNCFLGATWTETKNCLENKQISFKGILCITGFDNCLACLIAVK